MLLCAYFLFRKYFHCSFETAVILAINCFFLSEFWWFYLLVSTSITSESAKLLLHYLTIRTVLLQALIPDITHLYLLSLFLAQAGKQQVYKYYFHNNSPYSLILILYSNISCLAYTVAIATQTLF